MYKTPFGKSGHIFLYKVLNNYFNSDFSDLYTYSTIITFTRGISSNCLRVMQGYYVDQITFLTESLTIAIGTVYQIML